MRIKSFQLLGFSSFKDTGLVNLEPGFNLLIGQNNSGKSALLASLNDPLPNTPHKTLNVYQSRRLAPPAMQMALILSGHELEDAFLTKGGNVYWSTAEGYNFSLEPTESFEFEFKHTPGQPFQPTRQPPHGKFEVRSRDCLVMIAENGRLVKLGSSQTTDNTHEFISQYYAANLFFFDAQRLAVGRCASAGPHQRLLPRAENLPIILAELQGRQRTTYERLCRYLREIFSTVHSVSTSAAPNDRNSTVIWVWPTEQQDDPELAFELNNCGTGVSQVLAILTVALIMKCAVIVIDEINAFLHPSAVKALLRILQTHHADHQYIISSHSTEVMAAAAPSTVHLIRRKGYDSTVERLELSKIATLREAARELGVSMTDVFAADRIIWVEGPSEANCFPYLYTELVGEIPQGVRFSPVASTGDFYSKKNKRIFDIYDTIARAMGPLVEQVAFSFDRETLSKQQAYDLESKSKGRLILLPRRCFEYFLLDPAAISHLIQMRVPNIGHTASPEAVALKMKELGAMLELGGPADWKANLLDSEWLAQVDGARLLGKIISDITAARLSFDKLRDTIILSQQIAENRPETMEELKSYLSQLMQIAMSSKVDMPSQAAKG